MKKKRLNFTYFNLFTSLIFAWLNGWSLEAANLSNGLFSFEKTKRILNTKMPRETWYCGCVINKHAVASCNIGITRSQMMVVEWDHVVPAAIFPKPGVCVSATAIASRMSPRLCARRFSHRFSLAEADPVNLVPAESMVNRLKSSKLPGPSHDTFRAHCGFEVNQKVFNPPIHLRGDVARIWFHMNKKHFSGTLIDPFLGVILHAWHISDPISKQERQRSIELRKLGGRHLFVTTAL